MLDVLAQTKNSIQAYTDAMKIMSSNIQNFQTEGFKTVNYSFQTIFSSSIFEGNSSSIDSGGNEPFNIAQSMHLIPQGIDFTQGSLGTGKQLNAAITGQSLFVIKNDSSSFQYKRNSDFTIDGQGYLVDSLGRKVMGYKMSQTGDVNKGELSEIKMDSSSVDLGDVGFESNGILTTNYTARKSAIDKKDQTIPEGTALYQLALARFNNPQKLTIGAGGAFKATAASGPPIEYGVSNDKGFGQVYGGYTENSNVDASAMAIEGLQLQRGYNAVQSAMTMINKLLQDFVRAVTQ
jgi:flagellar hook protein FlgE